MCFPGNDIFFYEIKQPCFSAFSNCTFYAPERNDWFELANMNIGRSHASCAVFQGQCVVAGGYTEEGMILKSVETYDQHLNKWSFLPSSMQTERIDSHLLPKGNKMFVIGGNYPSSEGTNEVYDCLTKKFTFIAPSRYFPYVNMHLFTIGHKIFVFDTVCKEDPNGYVNIPTYDIVKNKWYDTSKQLLTGEHLLNFSSVILQKFLC